MKSCVLQEEKLRLASNRQILNLLGRDYLLYMAGGRRHSCRSYTLIISTAPDFANISHLMWFLSF